MTELPELGLKLGLRMDQGLNWGLILIWGLDSRLGLELFSRSVFWLGIVAKVSCSMVEFEEGGYRGLGWQLGLAIGLGLRFWLGRKFTLGLELDLGLTLRFGLGVSWKWTLVGTEARAVPECG